MCARHQRRAFGGADDCGLKYVSLTINTQISPPCRAATGVHGLQIGTPNGCLYGCALCCACALAVQSVSKALCELLRLDVHGVVGSHTSIRLEWADERLARSAVWRKGSIPHLHAPSRACQTVCTLPKAAGGGLVPSP